MYFDKKLMFSDGQSVTTAAPSDNVIDLAPFTHGNTFRDIGAGGTIYLVVGAQEPIVGGTLNIQLQTSTDNVNWQILLTAVLRVGDNITSVAVPNGVKRFLRINYTGSNITSGKVYAALTTQAPAHVYYAAGSKFNA